MPATAAAARQNAIGLADRMGGGPVGLGTSATCRFGSPEE